MVQRYRGGVIPSRSDELAQEAKNIVEQTQSLLQQSHLQEALQSIWSLVTRANQYVDSTAPFKLAKDPAQAARLDEVLYNLAETCRILAVLVWPFLPDTAEKIFRQLGLPGTPERFSEAGWGGLPGGTRIGAIAPLFPRKDV
jgi:methionyl-tRNA synthetase